MFSPMCGESRQRQAESSHRCKILDTRQAMCHKNWYVQTFPGLLVGAWCPHLPRGESWYTDRGLSHEDQALRTLRQKMADMTRSKGMLGVLLVLGVWWALFTHTWWKLIHGRRAPTHTVCWFLHIVGLQLSFGCIGSLRDGFSENSHS